MSKNRSMVDSDDLQVGANIGRAPEELRDADIDISDIDIVSERQFKDKAKEAKFMQEKVIIEIDDDDDPNSPVFIYSGHQGVSQWIERGKPPAIKRKFLYALLAAKQIKVACAFGKDGNGNEFNRTSLSGRTTYRVRLIRDDNPEGGTKWMQSVMQSG